MVRDIHAALETWATDASVGCVVLRSSAARAFCSGGDVKSMHAALVAAGPDGCSLPEEQLTAEYRLLLRMHTYPKPLVALVDGITFGFGLALCAFCRYSLATDTSRFAMPENNIGLFPDVGFAYLAAARMRPAAGALMALCEEQLMGGEAARACGIVTHATSGKENLDEALQALAGSGLSGDAPLESLHVAVRGVLEGASVPSAEWSRPLAAREAVAERCFFGPGAVQDGLLGAYAALRVEAEADDTEEQAGVALEILSRLRRTCPASQAVAWELLLAARASALEGGEFQDSVDLVASALARDFRAAAAMTQRGDFVEGVRATLVDKDGASRWCPADLEVSHSEVVALAKEITALDTSIRDMLLEGLPPELS